MTTVTQQDEVKNETSTEAASAAAPAAPEDTAEMVHASASGAGSFVVGVADATEVRAESLVPDSLRCQFMVMEMNYMLSFRLMNDECLVHRPYSVHLCFSPFRRSLWK